RPNKPHAQRRAPRGGPLQPVRRTARQQRFRRGLAPVPCAGAMVLPAGASSSRREPNALSDHQRSHPTRAGGAAQAAADADHAPLAIAYVATSGGDNVGLLVFNRQVVSYLPPQRGHAQLSAMTEALYNIKAQMIEPSYARAFQYLSQNCKRRSLVVILTDLVD